MVFWDYPLAITDGDYSGYCAVYYSFVGTVLGTATITPADPLPTGTDNISVRVYADVAGMQNYFDNGDNSALIASGANSAVVADVVVGQEYGLWVQGSYFGLYCGDHEFNLNQEEYPPVPEIVSAEGG